ncbi:MAG TPA: hypothetical protein VKT49_23405 [Bryobacteraceae bacterium]|nr:hypothetical protein [Bryobacteraceae bacterium]
MNRPNITITEIRRGALALALAVALLALAAPAFAHGGFDHVRGTVAKVDNNVLTVKTAKGDVDVKLNAQTQISKGNQKAAVDDLKPGSRVVVDIPEGSKDAVAHSVQIGVSSAPAHHAPEHK